MATDGLEKPGEPSRSCTRRITMNNLWSVWYCIIVVVLEIYLLVTNINNFTKYVKLPWPENADPRLELNAYIGLVGASVVLIPLFMITSILKVGNLPNDGHKLGIGESGDPELLLPDYYISKSFAAKLKRIWRHCGPTAPLLHIFSAMCLLMPKLLIQAKLIKHGFLSADDIWKTDLDFMILHKDRLVVLYFLTSLNFSSVLSKESGVEDKMFKHMSPPEVQLQELSPVSAEFINFALALLVYAIRYPSVFWHTSRSFGLLFSAQMVLNTAQALLAFAGFTVLYNVYIVGPESSLVIYDPHFLLDARSSLLMFTAYIILLVGFGCVIYFYGYLKYRENAAKQSQKSHITLLDPEYKAKCCGFAPHAMAFIILCLTSMCAAPLMYDFIIVYRGSLDGAVLASVIGTIFHLLFWVLLWLGLTIKQKWHFRMLIAGTQSKLTDPASLMKIAHEIEMKNLGSKHNDTPMLVIADGQAFTVKEGHSKKMILFEAKKATEPKKPEEEDIYWLKPRPSSPKQAKSEDLIPSKKGSWLSRKARSNSFKGSKVSFDDDLSEESPYGRTSKAASKSPKSKAKANKHYYRRVDCCDSDDGDYATLKADLPRVQEVEEDQMINEFSPLSPEDNEEDYVDYDYLSEAYPAPVRLSAPVTVHNNSYDSGMPAVHCDSVSDASSISPPDKANGSESSSSGNYSMSDKRISSSEDITSTPCSPTAKNQGLWRSHSLQRNVPTSLPLQRGRHVQGKPNIVVFNTHYNHRDSQLMDKPSGTVVIKHPGTKVGPGATDKFGRRTNVHLSSFSEEPEYSPVRKSLPNMNKRKYPGNPPLSQLNDLNQSPSKSSNYPKNTNQMYRQRDCDSDIYSPAC